VALSMYGPFVLKVERTRSLASPPRPYFFVVLLEFLDFLPSITLRRAPV
jgi:hypothetical protein